MAALGVPDTYKSGRFIECMEISTYSVKNLSISSIVTKRLPSSSSISVKRPKLAEVSAITLPVQLSKKYLKHENISLVSILFLV